MKLFWKDGELVPFDMTCYKLYEMLSGGLCLSSVKEENYRDLAIIMDDNRTIFKHPTAVISELHEAFIANDTYWLVNVANSKNLPNTHIFITSILPARNLTPLAFMYYMDSDYVNALLRKNVIDKFLADNV